MRPDAILYFAHVQSTPFARPRLDELLMALAFVREKDYPARVET